MLSSLPPSMTWVRQLSFLKLADGEFSVAPMLGRQDVIKFMTQPRRDELAKLLSQIIGKPVRLRVDTTNVPQAPAAADGATIPSSGGGGLSDRDKALALPLVRAIFELFPDATLTQVRSESQVSKSLAVPAVGGAISETDSQPTLPLMESDPNANPFAADRDSHDYDASPEDEMDDEA